MDPSAPDPLKTFGGTISDGIQDISAILPLLGTEQCERHVGTALDKGFLYAAATPLSVFGSLGIVKSAFATFSATITHSFYGGKWLDDAGFSTIGSVSSMITIAPGQDTKKYGAEIALEKLLQDQHIDNLELVSDIEFSSWGQPGEETAGLSLKPWQILSSWNVQLILASVLSGVISITPYMYLIQPHWNSVVPWIFPLLRSVGSLFCVVSIQFALQLRIHHITKSSLLLMKVRRQYPLSEAEVMQWEREMVMEERIRKLVGEKLSSDPEMQTTEGGYQHDMQAQLSLSWALLLLQLLLLVGMPMIVVGYVGCFNLVSQSQVPHGTYVWLGLEAALSVLRICLWGWNPTWDDHGTGMRMCLKLYDKCGIPPVPSLQSGEKVPTQNIKTLHSF
ncbi:hypothetical protein L218DRAFT_629698 [Marasmius fiardii PR-910]|nr:hypothetical protein L218DRAFT_629698 [Marasmius fiardii PR-910]